VNDFFRSLLDIFLFIILLYAEDFEASSYNNRNFMSKIGKWRPLLRISQPSHNCITIIVLKEKLTGKLKF